MHENDSLPYQHDPGNLDLVTLQISLSAFEGDAYQIGSDFESKLPSAFKERMRGDPLVISKDNIETIRSIFKDYVKVTRIVDHENAHYMQSYSLPYCLFAGTAIRKCMYDLRKSLSETALLYDLSVNKIAIPLSLYHTDQFEKGESPLYELSNQIESIYNSWSIVQGTIPPEMQRNLLIEYFGDNAISIIDKQQYWAKGDQELYPLGARDILECVAKITEIINYSLIIDESSQIEPLLVDFAQTPIRESIPLRIVSQALDIAPRQAATLVCAIGDCALLTRQSILWPFALSKEDNCLETCPGLRFVEILNCLANGLIKIDHKSITSMEEYNSFIHNVHKALHIAPYDDMIIALEEHLEHSGYLYDEHFSSDKKRARTYALKARKQHNSHLFAFQWESEGIHAIFKNPFLHSARIWLTDGTLIGEGSWAFESIQELWEIAYYSWFKAIVFDGNLFGESPVPYLPNLYRGMPNSKDGNKRDLLHSKGWGDVFTDKVGVPPNVFKQTS